MHKSQVLTNANTCVAQTATKIENITISPESSFKPCSGNVYLNPLEARAVLMGFAYSRNAYKWNLTASDFF